MLLPYTNFIILWRDKCYPLSLGLAFAHQLFFPPGFGLVFLPFLFTSTNCKANEPKTQTAKG